MRVSIKSGVVAVIAATLFAAGCAANEPLTKATGSIPRPIVITAELPTWWEAPVTHQVVADPERIVIEAISVDATFTEVGLASDGSMETPEYNSNLVGWYTEGPKPGAPGPAVIAAHVDQPGGGPDTFARLDELESGDEIVVIDSKGVEYEFVVDRTGLADKDELPYEEIWPATDDTLLTLITCDGPYIDGEYEDNLIVYAEG